MPAVADASVELPYEEHGEDTTIACRRFRRLITRHIRQCARSLAFREL